MKIKADKELLLYHLEKAVKFIPKKSLIPIHDHFLFQVDLEDAVITAANSEMQITVKTKVKCEERGQFCIPAILLVKTLKLMREPDVTLKVTIDGDKVEILLTAGGSKYNLCGQPANVFPIMQAPNCPNEVTLDGKVLRNNLDIVSTFVNPNHNVPSLQGVNMTEVDNEIRFVGTSGHYLSRAYVKPRAITAWEDITMTYNTAKAICDATVDGDIVDILTDKKKIVMMSGDKSVVVIATLIDAKFPDTNVFFKAKHTTGVVLHNMEMQDALKRLKLYASGDNATITVEIKGSTLKMQAFDEFNNHSGVEEIMLRQLADQDIKIGFSANYFIETLSVIEDPDFMFLYGAEPKLPGFVDPIPMDGVKSNLEFIMMPVHIN